MLQLLRPLIALLGFALLTANGASAFVTVSAEKTASGSAGLFESLIRVNSLASPDRARENLDLSNDLASDSPDAARGAASLIGRSFGRLGTVVENPGIQLSGFAGSVDPGHAVNQIINRGLSPALIQATLNNPTVVLQQAGGRFLFLTEQAVVVINDAGQVVTAYGQKEFLPGVLEVLSHAGIR
jgi:hypothetical protein